MGVDVRVSVFSPSMTTCIVRDCVHDFTGGAIQYTDTPGGSGPATLTLGLLYEQVFQRGYWTRLNVVEISTGDDRLQQPIAAGATKIYVADTRPYDPAQGEDTQQIYLWDGSVLTMGIPVTGVGTDGGGKYLTIGAPAAWPGNPSSIPAYGAGAIVGRRRYAGVMRRRLRPNQKQPAATITLGPVSDAFNEANGGYTVGATAGIDVTTAILTFVQQFASQWPQLTISASNFATMTGSIFQGSRTQASAAQMITDALNAIAGEQTSLTAATTAGSNTVFSVAAGTGTYFGVGATVNVDTGASAEPCTITAVSANSITVASTTHAHASGAPVVSFSSDTWVVRVGHDRAPRMVRLYSGATNTYSYNVSLAQDSTAFEPVGVNVTDEDATSLYNRILVYGNTNPVTGQPYSALVIDDAAVSLVGRYIDGSPATNTSLNSDSACAAYGKTLLNQYSIGAENVTLRVYTYNSSYVDQKPLGLGGGDVVRGVACVTITGFEGAGTPNVYGLTSSVVTTLDFTSGDSYQDVTFAPIEPDWNDAMAEAANAVASSIMGNGSTGSGGGAYSVSPEAFPPTWSSTSLVLGIPAFLAVFAAGDIDAVAATNLTLPASATTWIWLNSTGGWNLQSTPATQTGQILYGYATTSATGIVGFTQRAQLDNLHVGVGQINFGNHPAPTVSASTLAVGTTDNSVHAQVNTTVTITNVPTDNSVTGVAWYYRLHGDTTIKPVGEYQIVQSSASQTVPASGYFGFEVGAGQAIDVFVGFVGIGSSDYGPLTQIGTAAQISSGFTPASLVVTTPYLANGAAVGAPVISGGAAIFTPIASANGISAGVTIAFTITNQASITDGSLHEITLLNRVTGSGTAFQKYVDLPAQSSGSYSYPALDLSNGQAYDWEVQFRSTQGNPSPAASLGSSAAAQVVIGSTGLATMPNTFLSTAPGAVGPAIIAGGITGYPSTGGGGYAASYQFQTGDWNQNALPNWFDGMAIFIRVHGTTAQEYVAKLTPQASNTYQTTTTFPASVSCDIGFAYIDKNGWQSVVTWASGFTTNAALIAGTSVSGAPNLVVDSNQASGIVFNAASGTESSQGSPYVSYQLIDGISVYVLKGGSPTGANPFISKGIANALAFWDQPIAVVSGQWYTLSGYIDISQCTAGSATWAIVPSEGGTAYQVVTVQHGATNGRAVVAWQSTVTGNVYVQGQFGAINAYGVLAEPMLQAGQINGPTYVPGPANPSQQTFATMPTGVQTALDQNGNMLVSEFGTSLVTLATGTYAGYMMQTANGIVDTNGYALAGSGISAGAWLWQEWISVTPGTAQAGNGPTFTDGVGTNWQLDCYLGAGALIAKNSSGTVLGTWGLASNNGSNGAVHRYTFGMQNTDNSGDYRFVGYVDDTLVIDLTYNALASAGSIHCGWSHDTGATSYHKQFEVAPSTDRYEASPTAYQQVINKSAQIPKSTPLNAQGSIPPFTTDFVLHTATSGTSPNITMTYWIDNGTASTAVSFFRSDGSTLVTGYNGTSGAPMGSIPSLASSTTVYFLAWWSFSTSSWHVTAQTAQFSPAQQAAALTDGLVPTIVSSTTNSSSAGGGGGGIKGCPEVNEPIECRRDGEIITIPAGELRVGDELRSGLNPGTWNRVHDFKVGAAVIYQVRFEEKERSLKVDASHLFVPANGEGWINVMSLAPGTALRRGGGGVLTVQSVRNIGAGLMAHISCENMEYLFDETSSHNVKYL
jgi:hypothetical protein